MKSIGAVRPHENIGREGYRRDEDTCHSTNMLTLLKHIVVQSKLNITLFISQGTIENEIVHQRSCDILSLGA
jgi:hypothetical protein